MVNSLIANPMIANPAGAMMQGMEYGHRGLEMRRQNKLHDVLQQHGQGLLAGDPAALNALAPHDAKMALEFQKQHLGMDATRQGMEINQERLEMAREAARREAESHTAKMTAAEAAQESAKLNGILQGAMAAQDEATYNAWLVQNDVDPGQYPWAQRDIAIGAALGVKDVLDIRAKQQDMEAGTDYSKVTGASLGLEPDQAAIFDRLPPEQKAKAADAIAGGAFGANKGTSLRVGADGTIAFDANGGSGLGTAATNTIQGKQINAQETLARLSEVAASFKPEYLEIGTRLGASWANMKDKIGTASEEDQSTIAGFVEFKTNALHNLNRVLNELSGAAISPAEATRLRGELPDPGEGIWDGDGPTEFKTKMETQTANARNAALRYQMWQAQGAIGNPWDMMELQEVPAQISRAIRDAASIAEKEGFTGQAQKDRAKAILKQKYGLGG